MSVLQTIQTLFPPPALMSFPCVGVDISDTSVKYVQFAKMRPHDTYVALRKSGSIDIPPGIIERGNVHKVSELATVLKAVSKTCGVSYFNISLPEERAYLFETTIAAETPEKDIRGLLEFRLEENVPLSPRDAYFDYAYVGEDHESHEKRVVVVVYARTTITDYYRACGEAEVIPLNFEIEAQAIARSVIPLNRQDAFLLVDFGKTRMGVGIVYNGTLMYTSTIEIAGDQLSAELRTVLGNDTTESDITTIKNTRGLVRTRDNVACAEIFEKYAAQIADELEVRIQYWHSRGIDRDLRTIKKVILCGGSANLRGLPEFLSRKLEITTMRARVWDNAFSVEETIPEIPRAHSYGYATAIGLALRPFV